MSAHLAAIPYLDRPTDTNTSAIAPDGALRIHKHATLGMQVFRPVKNTSGGSIAINRVVQFKDASASEVLYSAAAEPTVGIAGITASAIANNSYGWVLCSGVTSIKTTAAAVAAGALVSTIGTDGEVTDTAVTTIEHCQLGKALTAVGGGGGVITVLVSGLL